MTTKHTPGQWRITKAKAGVSMGDYVVAIVADERGDRALLIHAEQGSEAEGDANAYLIGAAPELLKALEEAVDLAWIVDSHQVQFDPTVVFGQFYDFSGLDGVRRIEFYGQHSCIVWPGSKWSAYCTYEGSMWFEKFDTAAQAKEACMRLLDKVLPDHPAMRARAAIAKAKGERQ